MAMVLALLAWLGVSTPLRPACDKPLLPELAATLELVLPLLLSVGDDVAAVVQACATTMRYVTGTRIVVDGGRHL